MMAQRRRRRLRDLRNDQNLAQFMLEGTVTGKQLGTGSYGSVEEVGKNRGSIMIATTSYYNDLFIHRS